MRIMQIVCAIVCLGSLSFAGTKQCEKYATPCKASDTVKQAQGESAKIQAIHSCIVQAATADGSNGTACLKEQSGRRHQ
jgi:hypothetical protein